MLSLVVPSYNNLRHLKNLFDSFVRNSPDDVELIMIDDASTDGTAEWMESMYHSHPIGPAEFSQKDLDQADELCLPICVYSIQENNFNIFFPKSYGVKPFIGREYIHHFQNCWKLIYDYYDSKNMLANRNFNFYLEQNANKTFSEDVVFKIKTFFKKNNIKKQSTADMTRDDLIIFQKQSGVFSHFGVFLENDEFLHHQEGLLSSKNIMNDEFYKKVHSIYRIANN